MRGQQMNLPITDLHKALNTRELKQIRIKLKEEAKELKRLTADSPNEEELVEDEEEEINLEDLEDI